MYTKVSIPKNGDGAGCPTPRKSKIILVDVEDVASEPTREVGDVTVQGNLTLNENATAVGIYATASTVDITEEFGGDPDAEGVKNGLAFEHPGNSVDIKNFLEVYKNKGVIALVTECDGTSAGRTQIIGRVCNPLRLTVETTMNNEATKRKLTWTQAQNDKFLAGEYSGDLPTLAAEPSAAASTSASQTPATGGA